MKMATEVKDVTASTYSTPTLRSANAVSLANGTTASTRITGITMTMGTARKVIRSALAGVRSSLVSSLTRSAMGWSIPKGPHLLGPTRLWKRPSIRRSAHTKTAAPSSTRFTRRTMMANPATR